MKPRKILDYLRDAGLIIWYNRAQNSIEVEIIEDSEFMKIFKQHSAKFPIEPDNR